MSLPAKTEAGRRPSRPPGRPFCSWLRQKRGRPLITFAAYRGMRPGEIFALEWPDIDFDAMRVDVKRPASLTCRSRTTLAGSRYASCPRRATRPADTRGRWAGVPLKAPQATLAADVSGYWGKVLARAALDFGFYLGTKLYTVHYLHATLGCRRA
jgi:integrase